MSYRFRLIVSISAILVGQCVAELPAPIASEPLRNLLDAASAGVHASPGLVLEHADDGRTFTAFLDAEKSAGSVLIGPTAIPASTRMLRFSCRITLVGKPACALFATFAGASTPREPVDVAFSSQAAIAGDVVQDIFVPVPSNADSVTLEFRVKGGEAKQNSVTLQRPCLTVARSWLALPHPPGPSVLFRHSFSHPDGSADVVQGTIDVQPLWSSVLSTAQGKDGPGLRIVEAHDAEVFAIPMGADIARGHITFWLRPEWDAGDAREADMVKISQAGRPRLLVRKNHGWSFLLVAWDTDGKTHGASCSLRVLPKDQWSKINAVWDAGKGMRLLVNGVALGSKDCTWIAPKPGPLAIRIGEGQHGKLERAPYVLDEIEIRTEVPEGQF